MATPSLPRPPEQQATCFHLSQNLTPREAPRLRSASWGAFLYLVAAPQPPGVRITQGETGDVDVLGAAWAPRSLLAVLLHALSTSGRPDPLQQGQQDGGREQG